MATNGTVIFIARNKVVMRKLIKIEKLPHDFAQFSQFLKNIYRNNLNIFFLENFQTLDLFNIA